VAGLGSIIEGKRRNTVLAVVKALLTTKRLWRRPFRENLQDVGEREKSPLACFDMPKVLNCGRIFITKSHAKEMFIVVVHVLADPFLEVPLLQFGLHSKRQVVRRDVLGIEIVERGGDNVLVQLTLDLSFPH
jgi:hypothetical protein